LKDLTVDAFIRLERRLARTILPRSAERGFPPDSSSPSHAAIRKHNYL
jgi:hypothetical protein